MQSDAIRQPVASPLRSRSPSFKHFWQISFRNLWVRKARTFITASGIMLGVAAVFAINVMSASTTQSLKDFFSQVSGKANLTIADAGRSGEGMEDRAFRRVLSFEGVLDAAAFTNNRAILLQTDKNVTIAVAGIDPETDKRLRTYTLADGQFLTRSSKQHDLVLVSKFAAVHNLRVGDNVTLRFADNSEDKFRILGLLTNDGAGQLNGGVIAFITLDAANTIFNRGGKVDEIDLVATPGVVADNARLAQLKNDLQDALGKNFVVSSPAATGESVSQALSGLNLGLGIFSVIALFVGMLLIYNTFAMTIAERTREIGMFRSLGATRRQVLGLVLGEAIFLGIIGATLGILGGLGLAIPLVRVMSNMMGIPLNTMQIPIGGMIQAILIGFATTVIAAMLPAWQASRISPTEALRARGGGKEGWLLKHGWKVGIALLIYAFLEGMGILRLFLGPQFFMTLFLGMILIMPNLILWLERYTRGVIAKIYGPIGQFGSRNLARSKARTSLTVGVLMIGVVMTVAIGAMTTSFRASIDDWINAAVGGDFFISSNEVMRDDLAQDLTAVPGIVGVTPERLLQIKIAGTTNTDGFKSQDISVLMLGIDPATYRTVSGMQFSGGEDADAAFNDLARGDTIFISTLLRDRYKLGDGDTMRLRTGHGEHDFRVAGIVAMFYQGGQSFIISRKDVEKYWGDSRISIFVARKRTGEDAEVIRLRLKNGIGKTKNLDITTGDQYRQNFSTQISQVFGLFDAMVWISIIVGALGVINTMTMNILERIREIGTLRSIGMNRFQLAQMVLAEAATMGTLGATFGLLVAFPTSTVMVQGMSEGSGFPIHYVFPALAFGSGVIISLGVSQIAALYPTWRASRISVTEAIRSE